MTDLRSDACEAGVSQELTFSLPGVPGSAQEEQATSGDARLSAGFVAQEIRTVADLTDDHIGWMVKVAEPLPLRHRTFTLGKGFGSCVRRWTHEGVDYVGLTDDDKRPGIVGTERTFIADTPCELVRLVKRPRKRSGTTSDRAQAVATEKRPA